MRYGSRHHFAIEIASEAPEPEVRTVNIWGAGQWLTCDDNSAYVPVFASQLEHTARYLIASDRLAPPWPNLNPEEIHRRLDAQDDVRETYRFMNWGPTTDNVTAYVFRGRIDETVHLSFAFWRRDHPFPDQLGRVFTASLALRDLILILFDAATVLRRAQ